MPISTSFDEKQNNEFEKRLERRFKDSKLDCYSSFYYSKLQITVIEVRLHRAVIEYAESFKSYFNTEQTLNNHDYIIDLSAALFLDSTFLGAIIYSLKFAKSRGANLSLVIDDKKIKILSHLDNLKKIISIYPSVEEAIEQLRK